MNYEAPDTSHLTPHTSHLTPTTPHQSLKRLAVIVFMGLLWLVFNRPGLAQTNTLFPITFDPPVVNANTPLTAVIKNYTWDTFLILDAAQLTNYLDNQPNITVNENLPIPVGPRRRANLPITTSLTPGLWSITATGTTLGRAFLTLEGTVAVATGNSTTGLLTLGQTVQGIVETDPAYPGVSYSVWAFHSSDGGEEVDITFAWDEPIPYDTTFVSIFDDAGNSLATATDFVHDLTFSRPGTYYIYVGQNAPGTYPYTLSLTTPLSGDNDFSPLAYNQPQTGLIDTTSDQDHWSFTANAGQIIQLDLYTDHTETLNGELILTNPNGATVAQSQRGNFGPTASLSHFVTIPGTYQVIVQPDNNTTSGGYSLHLSQTDTLDDDHLLTYLSSDSGFLPQGGSEAWQFNGQAGDDILVGVLAIEENLDLQLTLYAPDGSQIAFNDDTNGLNPVITHTLPTTGLYTLAVTTYDNNTAGNYQIVLSEN